jgi:hypothetical protein
MHADLQMRRHAAIRRQDRGIPELAIRWLFEFGSEIKQNGATVMHFDKAARRRLQSTHGKEVVGAFAKFLDTYLVEAPDGSVITVAYRYKRLRRY